MGNFSGFPAHRKANKVSAAVYATKEIIHQIKSNQIY